MRDLTCTVLMYLLASSSAIALHAQTQLKTTDAEMEQRLEAISNALTTTRQQLDQSQQQIVQLQAELAAVRQQLASRQDTAPASGPVDPAPAQVASSSSQEMEERQQTVEAQVKVLDQSKVESGSKYPVRLTGLILFNGFLNRGSVDNIDLPSIATRQTPGTSDGSAGATMRQTILGIEANGPRIAGARSSADVSLDFFGGIAYSNYGTASGIVRMRTASVNLDWSRDSVQFGMVAPLISPLNPTSYATVAEPGMAWAGNLWSWAPQLRIAHRFPLSDDKQWMAEFGLWDPSSSGYNKSDVFRAPSAGEQTKQPGYEGRVSFGSGGERGFQAGVGGYYSRQTYGSANNDAWAFTADWRVPLAHRFELSGEGYRGRSLGGLGGGVYKDVIFGTDPISGATVWRGLNDIGGWTQFKSHFGRSLEANATIGQDNGFASDFHAVNLPSNASQTELRARNRMLAGNLIYRPKTYLIFSPEYRRIWTWPISGKGSTADIFTLSVGYQF
ncbi:hypothetical protein [Edaphobacter aggregans]|uniref:hypothetical protein n=1 Tax=Edaphobacter aggregans TaxID=570835 RepID=UPI00054F7158|nr:hypothetical protein [Edaphobacter aggregans]